MIPVTKFKHQQVIVLGLGRSGVSSMCSLLYGGSQVIAIDDNLKSLDELTYLDQILKLLAQRAINDKRLILNPDIEKIRFEKIKAIVVSPGIPTFHPKPHYIISKAKNFNIPITSDMELLYESCNKAKFVGVTGTNGKSTTTMLLGHILKKANKAVQIGGNIGIGVLKLEPLHEDGVYVLEASSFQLELLNHTRFNIAILLNLTPDHLDRHGDFNAYKAAKIKIFQNQKYHDYSIISIDQPYMREIFDELALKGKQKLIPISTEQIDAMGVSIVGDILYDNIDPDSPKKITLPYLKRLPGTHNKQNIAAAYAAAIIMGVSHNKIMKALTTFQGLEHRLELVLEKGGLKFINDSKATNTNATEKALSSYTDIYWIAGGISKDEGIESLSHLFNRLKHVYLVGEASENFSQVLQKHNIPFTVTKNIKVAIETIKNQSIESGVVLLSPACSSLDQWKDYEHRGRGFKEIVYQLYS